MSEGNRHPVDAEYEREIESLREDNIRLRDALVAVLVAHDEWWEFGGLMEEAEVVEMGLHEAIDWGVRRALGVS